MIAKATVIFAILAAVHANAVLYGHGALTGVSARAMKQDAYGNYAFGYDIKDAKGATNSRSEVGDGHGNVKGSYTLSDIDGRARKVEYVADGHGFRAAIKTNEPGTAHSAPAAVVIASPYGGPSDAAIKHVAPVVAKVVAAGPLLGHGSVVAPVGYGYGGYGVGYGGGYGAGYGAGYGGHGAGYGGYGDGYGHGYY